jgi:hypothetical protein
MTDAMIDKSMYSFIDSTELPPVQPKFASRPLSVQQRIEYNSSDNAAEKYQGRSNNQLKEMFEAVKYEYTEYDKNNKRYNRSIYFIKKNLSKENRQTVANLQDSKEI